MADQSTDNTTLSYKQRFLRALTTVVVTTIGLNAVAIAAEGITADRIKLGQSAPLTGALAKLGTDYRDGAALYFKRVNDNGGINGRSIDLVTLDDAYVVDKTVENVKRLLVVEQVFALFNMFGTGQTRAILPLATQAKTPIFSTYSGADVLRTAESRYIFHTRAGYPEETDTLLKQVSDFGFSKVAVAYQDNDFGKAALRATEAAARKRGAQLLGSVAVDVNSAGMEKTVASVLALQPDAVLVLTAGRSSIDFMMQYRKASPFTWLLALSVVSSKELVAALGEQARGIVVSQVVPYPWGSAQVAVVKEYQSYLEKAGKTKDSYSYAGLEGFISAKVFSEALRRSGRDLSREKLIATLETMGKIDVGGFTVTYAPGDHSGSKFVDTTIISRGGKFIR